MTKNTYKELIVNSVYLYFGQGINFILPLLVLPYLIKTLSSQSFGIYSFAFAFTQFSLLFVDFGFNISATKNIAENVLNPKKTKMTFWNVTSVKCFFMLVSLLFTFTILLSFSKFSYYKEAVLINFITVIGTILYPTWLFQGINKLKAMTIINIISKLITYPFVFIFVTNSTDFLQAIFIQSLSFLVAGLLSLIYLIKYQKFLFEGGVYNVKKHFMKNEIKDSFSIFLSNSSISLYTNSLTIFLGFFYTPNSVGIFSSMERLIRTIVFGVLAPINQAAFPIIINLKKESLPQAKDFFLKIFFFVVTLVVLVYIFIYFFNSEIINKFFHQYKNSESSIFIYFAAIIFPIAMGSVFGQLGLLGLGNELQKKIFSRIYIYIGIFSLPLSLFLIYKLDYLGAIYSMVFVEFLVFIVMGYFVKKYKFL
ncbi:oligosaccharide flippase family protein [Flavobacterium sp.]|uniref:oligosaccharide flippase family protein n=1 Tax=Flavobacterium sp. TaxID=239 RepID=UPI0037534A85